MAYEPFKNIKIIDLSTVLAGPSVGTFFAELGAEVMKVEHPEHRDVTRSWKLPTEKEGDISAYFSSVNYQKYYWPLDLTIPEQHAELLSLVEKVDMVLMNYKLGDQEKLNIDDARLRENNPQLIIGKINGFGDESDRLAYDLILQAETGFMAMNGCSDGPPVKMPVALIDVLTAHQLKEGLLIELLTKATHPNYKGQSVSVALYDAAVSSLVNQASNYLMAGHVPQRIGSLHPNIAPYGELFHTADHKTLTFAIGSNRQFEQLCTFLNAQTLVEDERFATVQARVEHRKALFEMLYPMVKAYTGSVLLAAMRKQKVPCGEVKDLKAVFDTDRAKSLVREEATNGQLTKRVTSVAFKRQD